MSSPSSDLADLGPVLVMSVAGLAGVVWLNNRLVAEVENRRRLETLLADQQGDAARAFLEANDQLAAELAEIAATVGSAANGPTDGEPVCLGPLIAPRNALAARARGDIGGALSGLGSLRWAVDLVGDIAKQTGAIDALWQSRALRDVERIARGLLPVEPETLAWALKVAVPAALPFGPEGQIALLAAATLLDELGNSRAATTSAHSDAPSR